MRMKNCSLFSLSLLSSGRDSAELIYSYEFHQGKKTERGMERDVKGLNLV